MILLLVAWWGMVLGVMAWTPYARARNLKHEASRELW